MRDCDSASDGDLFRRMKNGDENAFTALYRRHQTAVYRFALQMSGSSEIAEEVTQEAFMVLMVGAKYNPERGPLGAFLFGVARNHVLRILERGRPMMAILDEEMPAEIEDEGARMDRNRQIAALRKAVLALPPHYREVVVLCELQEMDYSEAAALLDCPVGTIRSRLNRARSLLAGRLRPAERCPA